MKKIIIVLSALLLCAVPAVAEEVDVTINSTRLLIGTTHCVSPATGVTCSAGKAIGQWDIEILCLAKMVAAMKAIDSWVGDTWEFDTDEGATYHKAKALWNATRRECWSKP